MRDFREAKTMARSLRQGLKTYGAPITHSQSLELMAKVFGVDNWNILAARIAGEAAPVPAATAWRCSFCGKPQTQVKMMIAGPDVAICDDCVGICNEVIEHQEVLARLGEDEAAGRDDLPALGAYLAARSRDQLDAYLLLAERELQRTREGLAAADAELARRARGSDDAAADAKASFLSRKSEAEIAKHRAAMADRLARGERAVAAVRARLAE